MKRSDLNWWVSGWCAALGVVMLFAGAVSDACIGFALSIVNVLFAVTAAERDARRSKS